MKTGHAADDLYYKRPRPFVWTVKANDILQKSFLPTDD
jgi:hypothetical protein